MEALRVLETSHPPTVYVPPGAFADGVLSDAAWQNAVRLTGFSQIIRPELLISEMLERIATTMMSLVDRPRPKLALVPAALMRHVFAFVWLPRDIMSTATRKQIEAMLVEAPEAKDHLLKQLIGDHEPPYAAQWRGLGEDYQHKMLNGIVAFELRITELQCKLKLNQHRPESHVAMHAAYAQGSADERALAEWMVKLGMVQP